MDAPASALTAAGTTAPPGRRADAGTVRLGARDVAGLLLCGDMNGAPSPTTTPAPPPPATTRPGFRI
jgi:hypothetical protein